MSDEQNIKDPKIVDESDVVEPEAQAPVPTDIGPASDEAGMASADEVEPDGLQGEVEPDATAEKALDEPGVSDSTPQGAEDAAATEAFGTIPSFLTHDGSGDFGDDPDPLPEGFEVIDGGASPSPEPIEIADDRDVPETQRLDDIKAAGENFSHAAAEAASNVSAFLTQGARAVREMSAAKRAHAEARGQLDELDRRIADQARELEQRIDITCRFDQIVAEQNARKSSAQASVKAARALQKTIQEQIDALKAQLEKMKEADAATEKQLKSALEAAEGREEDAREAATRLKRRLADAQKALEKAEASSKERIEAAEHAVADAESKLASLREEYAEIQRNPSANSAAYSVRDTELAVEISDVTEQLRRAKDELPRVTADAQATLAAAQTAVHETEKPIADAKESFRSITDATAEARDALDAARKDAAARQKELKGKISEQEKDLKEQQRVEAEAAKDAEDADRTIAEATDIHDHPEITERIAAACEADRAEREEQAQQVQSLAEVEANVRERTRSSRLKFIAAIVGVSVVILLIVILWFTLS